MADESLSSPLHRELYEAARKGDLESVKDLLQKGASPRGYIDYGGRDAIMMSAERGHVEVVKLLGGVDLLNDPAADGETSLTLAAARGHLPMIDFILATQKSPPEALRTHLIAALSIASYNGHLQVVRLLIEKYDAPYRVPDADGMTPLQNSLAYGAHPKQKRLERHEETHGYLVSLCDRAKL
eukprot:TRINITY_DN32202_c0_g1_i1.p1 TRINITY_DN32202_c0_g1~~TRINITY_DN32202_c0_g1_i1.p1  ORF type:complete len:198 (+),score=34.41 TRINITY_DN32202_c0_g1_i1:47-595(+)